MADMMADFVYSAIHMDYMAAQADPIPSAFSLRDPVSFTVRNSNSQGHSPHVTVHSNAAFDSALMTELLPPDRSQPPPPQDGVLDQEHVRRYQAIRTARPYTPFNEHSTDSVPHSSSLFQQDMAPSGVPPPQEFSSLFSFT